MAVNMMSTKQKALHINLDDMYYGTFAEIGAGQEVARHFFQAGAASKTVAKSISAYDMTFSDTIYGREESGRYVCLSRLVKMLDREYRLICERLGAVRGEQTKFFTFADTVATSSPNAEGNAHGWLGIRFQASPGAEPNDIIVHVKMLDPLHTYQQETLGRFGVNLIYAAFYYYKNIDLFLTSLLDNMEKSQIGVNMIKMTGPIFESLDNRLVNLELVKRSMTDAVLFDESGRVVLAADQFYKKNVQIVRGSYRPPTLVNVNMIKTGKENFARVLKVDIDDVFSVAEITMNNLAGGEGVNNEDFLARVDMCAALNQPVLISNIPEFYKLVNYLNNFRVSHIGLVLGGVNFQQIFDVDYYSQKSEGIFSALGQLFQENVKVLVYPFREEQSENMIDLGSLNVPKSLKLIYKHLLNNKSFVPISNYDDTILHIYSRRVFNMITECKEGWEKMTTYEVAQVIREKSLYGYSICATKK